MNIKDAQYIKNPIENKVNMIKANIDGEESWIPLDPNNRHYAEILKQVKEGKLTIKDAD
jgi:hypothetical protein